MNTKNSFLPARFLQPYLLPCAVSVPSRSPAWEFTSVAPGGQIRASAALLFDAHRHISCFQFLLRLSEAKGARSLRRRGMRNTST